MAFLSRLLGWLVGSAEEADVKDRRKLKLLTGLLLATAVNGFIGVIVRNDLGIDAWVNLLVVNCIIAIGYGLSRAKFYKPALIIILTVPALNIVGMVITGSEPIGIVQSLPWLVLPFLVASIFLSRLQTFIVATGYLVFMGVLLPLAGMPVESIGETLAFFVMVFFLVIAITVIRQRDRVRIENELARRVEAEDGLRINEERFRIMADNASDMMIRILLEPTFKVDYVSPSAERITGYAPAEFYEDSELGFKIIHPDDRQRFIGYTKNKDMEHHPSTVRMIRKDGNVIWTEQVFNTIKDDDGKPVAVQSICRDVTERRLMEQEIETKEERYRLIFESANDIIVFMDNKGDIIDVNRKATDIGGYTRGELVGKNIRTLTNVMTKKSAAIVVKNFMLRLLGKDVPAYEVEMYRGNGEKLNVEINAMAVKDGDKVIGNLATLRDVTGRRRAEAVLEYQRSLIDQILAATPNAVLVIDEKMKLLLANDTFYKKFYLKKSRVEDKPLDEVIRAEGFRAALTAAIKDSKNENSFEFRYKVKEMPRICLAKVAKMQRNRYLVLISDITEERENQERLYLTDRLASVGEMAAGVAHELNNPLTSIIGLSSLLNDQEELPADTRDDLAAINSEAQRCAAIVKSMLTFARKHAPMREPLQLRRVVKDVLDLRAYELRSQNIKLETDLPDDLPKVMADYFQMQQVFLNIVLNAESAMGEADGQGTLQVTAKKIDGHVAISFSDDGPGISKENMGLIFNPFFTTKGVGKGSGLGLSISYGIVASHGGRIYAKGNADKGTTFVVELPVIGS
ncbi:MAG: PAS domain S-box protein [Dehalococcoidia bacterium]|jgi:PAS domain S-box-containing protein